MIVVRDPSTAAIEIVESADGYPGWDVVGDVPGGLPLNLVTVIDDVVAVDMDAARAAKWGTVKVKRDAVQTGGCLTPSGRVQTDLESRGLINGAVTMALIAQSSSQPYSIAFTLADNSTVTLDAAAMIALGVAVGAFIAAAHAHSVALRSAIDAATTSSELDAINIEEGWPE